MQGAQKLRSEGHLQVRRNDEVAAQRRRWTFLRDHQSLRLLKALRTSSLSSFAAARLDGLLPGGLSEAEGFPRHDLGQGVQVRADDIGNLGIPPRNLSVPEENNRQAVAGDLYGAPGYAFGDDVGPLQVFNFGPSRR